MCEGSLNPAVQNGLMLDFLLPAKTLEQILEEDNDQILRPFEFQRK
jgi:hypothetical protein